MKLRFKNRIAAKWSKGRACAAAAEGKPERDMDAASPVAVQCAFESTGPWTVPILKRSEGRARVARDCEPWTVDGGLGDQGVALVITLIMLSIITFMAITFLVLSQRERTSANTATDQKIVAMAADTGLNRAVAELTAQMLVLTNWQNMQFMVSTSFNNPAGFNNGLTTPYATNVNYDYQLGGTPYNGTPIELERNEANLLINPEIPVYVVTDPVSGAGEFRFYLDLNRNGRYDRNGTWPVVVGPTNNPQYLTTNASGALTQVATNYTGWVVSNTFVGDPEWIGILERPQEFHSADNKAVARYAYMVIPVGNTLDINYIHNRAKRLSTTGEGFLRNQGASTFEINLAGFLADLNTNIWWTNNGALQYFYNTNLGISSGLAFSNANDLLTYRYGGPTGIGFQTLAPANRILANAATLANAGIDLYSQGPLMFGTSNNDIFAPVPVGRPWSGANNTNHFWTIQDVFDPAKAGPTFPTLLQEVGTSNDSYNAYTYYRLLAQLGSDSAPDHYKMNVNFKNTDNHGRVVIGMETNLIPWTPIDFFTNAADRMFRQLNMRDLSNNLITITNIPLYWDPARYGSINNINYYTPAVHRVLQLAANMYDATTSRFIGAGPTNYPSVFRPLFRSQNGIVSIAGYEEVSNSAPVFYGYMEVTNFAITYPDIPLSGLNLYGVPWVIGMKKGFPNFSELAMNNPLTCTRKIEFTNSVPKPPWQTNQLFDFSITNAFGMEAWNSYTNAYGRSLRLIATNALSILITNQFGNPLLSVVNLPYGNDLTFANGWPGWSGATKDNSFQVPVYAINNFTNGIYLHTSPYIVPLNPTRWDAQTIPEMFMTLSFRLYYVLIDTSVKPNRVLDFVNIETVQPTIDISGTLAHGLINGNFPNSALDEEWATNFHNGTLVGVQNQIWASEGAFGYGQPTDWKDTVPDWTTETALFRQEINNGGVTNYFQAPYNPSRTIFQGLSWEANDPLVHYTAPDLTSTNGFQKQFNVLPPTISQAVSPLSNLTNLNYAYQPWGGYHTPNGSPINGGNPPFDYDYQVKDPGTQQSDNWDFPTNKFWNIGILGRVHRGTPWQTVYLKPFNTKPTDWTKWGNDNIIQSNFVPSLNAWAVYPPDESRTEPTNDYALFDLFTAGISDNATRGQLNVNQTNLAALSAVLSGVNVLTNDPVNGPTPMTISPAGVYSNSIPNTAVAEIWQGINNTRANTNPLVGPVFLNQTFQHAGDILATPQLSVASPFLRTNQLNSPGAGGISDEILERIPQQIMSLLTLNQTPRFVIYSFGQTLHPADHSLVIGGTYNGLCTNYQVTAEIATRAVVRIDGSPDPRYTQQNPDPYGRYYPPRVVVEQFNVLPPF